MGAKTPSAGTQKQPWHYAPRDVQGTVDSLSHSCFGADCIKKGCAESSRADRSNDPLSGRTDTLPSVGLLFLREASPGGLHIAASRMASSSRAVCQEGLVPSMESKEALGCINTLCRNVSSSLEDGMVGSGRWVGKSSLPTAHT